VQRSATRVSVWPAEEALLHLRAALARFATAFLLSAAASVVRLR